MRATAGGNRFGRRELLTRAVAVGGLAGGFIVMGERPGHAVTTVLASSFGFDPTDATSALQAALDSAADEVVIDDVGADWISGPLFVNRDDIVIRIEVGVTLRSLPGAFPHDTNADSEKFLTIEGRSGVTISGYGATLVMDRGEFTSGEWRHAVNILSCTDVSVEGLQIVGSGGDGIYLGVSPDAALARHNTNVVVRNVTCDGHRRNGLSVISVDGLLVEGSAFRNTSGTSPAAGIDLEPNVSAERLSNIIVRDCVVSGNQNRGLIVVYKKFRQTTLPISVELDRVAIVDQAGAAPAFAVYGNGTEDPGGVIGLHDCLIECATHSSAVGVFRKAAYGTHVEFNQVSVRDVGTTLSSYDTMVLWATDAAGADGISEYGGLTLSDSVVVTDHYGPYLSVNEVAGGAGLGNLHGQVTVVGRGASGPAAITQDLGLSPHDVDLSVTATAGVPITTVSISVSTSSVTPGQSIMVTATRSSADLSTPLAVRLALGGTARERYDFDGTSSFISIPTGAASGSLVIATRSAGLGSYSRDVTFLALPSPLYSIATGLAVVTIDQP